MRKTHKKWDIVIRLYALVLFPGVNFTDILRAAFTYENPKSAKSQVKQLFVLLGSARIKASRKLVDEIDPSRFVHLLPINSFNYSIQLLIN